MMLRGMGFQNDTPIFVAAGRIYNAEKNMAPLHQMFPFVYTKETLLSEEELEPFKVNTEGILQLIKAYWLSIDVTIINIILSPVCHRIFHPGSQL